MAPNYTRLAQTTQRLIEAAGKPVTLVKLSRTPDNVLKPWRGNADVRDDPEIILEDVKVLFIEPSSLVRYGIEIKDDEMQERRVTQIVIVAALSVDNADLNDFDELIDGDGHYRIKFVRKLYPGPTPMFTVLGLER